MSGLRLMIYDTTERAGEGLVASWFLGGKLYKLFRALDIVKPAESWEEALDWAANIGEPGQKIDVLQYWGHGAPAGVALNGKFLSLKSLKPGGFGYEGLCALKDRLHSDSIVWFRTCSTFHGSNGKEFAKELANFLGCRVAAHTFIIGPFQSGLRTLSPGEEPYWSDSEGLDADGEMRMSMPWDVNTITCLHGFIPKGW